MKFTEEHERHSIQNNQSSCNCKKCKTYFTFEPNQTWWDEKGFGYSTKLCRCPECGCINVVKQVEDYGLSFLNTDKRYFS